MHVMNTLSMAHLLEPILWVLVLLGYLRIPSQSHFLSFRLYLVAQVVASGLSIPTLFLLESLGGSAKGWPFDLCTQVFWWGAILAGGFAIATLRGILKRLLAAVPGLQRVFLIVFQWILVAAALVILEHMISEARYATYTSELATLADGMVVMQLLLLLPLLPFTFMVRRSLRSHYQDLMMGLGVLAISNTVLAMAFHTSSELGGGIVAISYQVILMATQIFWIYSFATQQKQAEIPPIAIDARLLSSWEKEPKALDGA